MLLHIASFVIVVIGLLYLVHYLVHGSRRGKLINQIPGPYVWPFFGNIFEFLVPFDELWDVSRKFMKRYYPVTRIWSMFVPMVIISHPDDVEALLSSTKHTDKSLMYEFLHPWLGTGLLTSNGAKWHKRRRILTPAFHFQVLQQFVGIFIEHSQKLTQSLCQEGDEVVPDLVALLHKYTLNAICATTMGFTSDVDGDVLSEYRSCVSDMGDITLYRLVRPWTYVNWMFRFFRKFKEQVRLLKVLHGFSTSIIKERKRYHEETDGQHLKGLDPDSASGLYILNEEHIQGKRRLAMLDLLIAAAKREASIDDEGIREEVDTFVFEGHDTTAMGLCFALLLLAENKEAQDKARAEVDAVFGGKNGSEISLRDLQNLAHLERCIKESLRLFPSVPFISRHISEDLQLKKYLVPEGTIVNVFFYDLHRNPKLWPDPEVFNPDRFLPGQVAGRHPFAFVPFSAGPRNCIGQKFALLEMKALIGTFLRDFYLEPIDSSTEVQIRSDLVLRPKFPIRIKFVRRSPDDIRNSS